MRRDQLRAFETWLQDTPALKEHLNDRKAREEAQMLLQFEALKRPGSYPPSVLEATAGALAALEELDDGEAAEAVPNWFIPPYEVGLGDFIDQASTAKVYRGKWFDTDVVVKRLMPASSSNSNVEYELEAFRREADIWFMLNHENVVHLYGACHVGTSFFVYESTKATSYFHDRGFVHGDLKCNNFMVGTDGENIKLGDFGQSVLKRQNGVKEDAHKVLGAFRWKAPECLLGPRWSQTSSASACAISGEFPWGPIMPDPAVKFHVTKRKSLPPRPARFTDDQWNLIQRMCCFDPKERISLPAVLDLLRSLSR